VELGILEPNNIIPEPVNIISETEELVRILLQKADRKANEIINQAKAEVQELLANAAEEAKKIKEQAYQKGYQDGHEAAEKQMEGMKQQILAEVSQLHHEATRKKDNYLLEVKEDLIELAIDTAQKIIYQQLALQPDAILAIVDNALKEANPNMQERIIIQVAPDSLHALTEAISGNKISWPADRLEVEANPDLTPGSCIVIAPGGTYQLIIEETIEKLKELFQGAEING
jgi:flagellar assembly protein FliH